MLKYKNAGHNFKLMDEKNDLVEIEYTFNSNGVLRIHNINRTSWGEQIKYQEYHLGTTAMNLLIGELRTQNKNVGIIKGTLSNYQAKEYWGNSLPFYFHFPNYFTYPNLAAVFHLFYDEEYKNEIVLNENTLKQDVDSLIMYSIKYNADLYFYYEIVEMKAVKE